jgi:SAM-dependent methyltransferase
MDLLLEATHRVEARHFWFRGFRQFVRPFLASAAAGLRDPRLLDCGCGTGRELPLLATFGRPFGLDLTWTGLEIARQAGETRVARGSVTRLPFADATFDIVASFDVLYCLPDKDEAAAVHEMYRVLRPGGAAVTNVAAMSILRGNHSVLAEEVRRYDKPRLRRLLQQAGFRIERLTYTNASLFPLMLAVRTFHRAVGLARPEEATRELALPPAPLNALATAALSAEALVLRLMNMPFGSSLLCLSRKPE